MAKTKDTVSHDGHRQRMKERLLRDGLESFSEHEMLELLLFYALPYRDTNALGHVLIDRFGSLCNVLDAAYADLLKVPGVTPHIATLLTLCGQTAHSYMRRRYQRGTLLYTAKELGEYILPWFIGQKAESVVLVSMDNRSKLLNATRIFEGSVNSAQFNFRTAVQQACRIMPPAWSWRTITPMALHCPPMPISTPHAASPRCWHWWISGWWTTLWWPRMIMSLWRKRRCSPRSSAPAAAPPKAGRSPKNSFRRSCLLS